MGDLPLMVVGTGPRWGEWGRPCAGGGGGPPRGGGGGPSAAGAGLEVEGQLEAADQDQVLGMSSEAWPRKRVGVPNDQCKMESTFCRRELKTYCIKCHKPAT